MNLKAMSGTFVVLLLLMSSVLVPALPFGLGEHAGARAYVNPWPMFGKDRVHSSLSPSTPKGIMDPYKVWDNGLLTCWGSTVGDFHKNIVLENVTTYTRPGMDGVYSRGTVLQIIEGLSGKVMWQVALGTNIQAATGLTDTDRDQRVEVAVATEAGQVALFEPTIKWNGTAYLFNQTNAMKDQVWSRNVAEPITYSSLAVGDITNDGLDDIVLATQLHAIAINGTNGDRLWNHTLEGGMTGTPAILDFGKVYRRVAYSSYNLTPPQKLYITMLDNAGTHLWTKNVSVSPQAIPPQVLTILPSVSAGDVDKDGDQELLVASPFESGNGQLRAYELNGDEVWTNPFDATGMIEATPVVADLTKDKKDDAIIVSCNLSLTKTEGHVYAVNGTDGTEIWHWDLPQITYSINSSHVIATPALIDLNHDGVPDVIIGANNGHIYAIDGTSGALLWNLATNRPPIISSPAVADMDGNGINDLFIDGMMISHKISELSIADADITFDNPTPEEGNTIHISAVVYNTGTRDAKNVSVRFDDNYDRVVTHLGYDMLNISAGDTAGANLDYTIQGGGNHKIIVVVDPDNKIEELNENDNVASKTVNVGSHWSLVLTPSPAMSVIDPGNQTTYTIKVKNTGDMQNVIGLALSSTPPNTWSAALTQSLLTLDPNEEQSVALIVSTSSSSLAGQYPINVTGTSQNKTTNHNTTQLMTVLRGQYGVLLSSDNFEKNVNAEGFASFYINVSNVGNSEDLIAVTNSTPQNASWFVFLSSGQLDIEARGSKFVTLTVKPPTEALIGDTEVITVTAKSLGNPALTDHLTFTTHVVPVDLAINSMTFYRKDGTLADGTLKHVIANRTTRVNISVQNLLGNIDAINSVYLELTIDGTVSGMAFINIATDQVAYALIDTSFKVGHHTVKACIDANSFIKELDENNNCMSVQVTAKSDTAVGPYKVFGTIFWPSGAPVSKADVTVTNNRTLEALALKSDDLGNYTMGLQSLPSGYLEEEQISVAASNGITVREKSFLAYSEDASMRIDIVLTPQPYDFYIGPQVKVSTEPGKIAVFPMFINQLGSATNNVTLNLTGLPSGWKSEILDNYMEPVKNLKVSKGQTVNFTVQITPPKSAKANDAGQVLTLTGTSVPQPDKSSTVSLIVGIKQVYKINYSLDGGEALPGTVATFNVNLTNTGNGDDVVIPTITNNTDQWTVSLSPQKLNLSYLGSKNLVVQVQVPMNASGGTEALALDLAYGKTGHVLVPLNVTVLEFDYSLQLKNNDISSQDIAPGGSKDFSFSLINSGNVNNSASLIVLGTPNDWTVSLTDLVGTQVFDADVAVGQSVPLLLKVKAPLDIKGDRNIVINVTAISTVDPLSPPKQSTAFALLSVIAPDLLPVGNITFSKKSPTDGDKLTISVTVRNMGTGPSTATTAVFYVDNRSIGQATVGVTQKNAQTLVSMNWTAKAGVHTVRVRVNPNETLVEMNYDNNVLQNTIDVKAKSTALSPTLMFLIFIIVLVVVAGAVYYMWTKPSKGQKPKKRRPAPVEDEEEETEEEPPEDELPDIDEEEYQGPQEEEVHEVEEVEARPVKAKPKKVVQKPKKNVARPMTFAENYKDEEHEDVDIDKDDMGGVIRFR